MSLYKSMLERNQNKFSRFSYLRQYGVCPGYPQSSLTLFILGMVGYSMLDVRRVLALVTYMYKVLKGQIHSQTILQIRLCPRWLHRTLTVAATTGGSTWVCQSLKTCATGTCAACAQCFVCQNWHIFMFTVWVRTGRLWLFYGLAIVVKLCQRQIRKILSCVPGGLYN